MMICFCPELTIVIKYFFAFLSLLFLLPFFFFLLTWMIGSLAYFANVLQLNVHTQSIIYYFLALTILSLSLSTNLVLLSYYFY